MANILKGLYANIPSPQANTGSYYYATDSGTYYLADGDKWIQSTPDIDNSSTPINQDGGLSVHVLNAEDNSGVTGTITASATTFTVTTTGYSTLTFQAVKSGTLSAGSISVYGSVDGTTFSVLTSYVPLTSGNTASSFSATNTITAGQIDTVGLKAVQFVGSSFSGGGSVVFTVNQSVYVSNVMLDNSLPQGTNVIGGVSTQAANVSVTFINGSTSSNIGTAAALLSAGTATKSLSIQNTSASATIYVGTAATPSTANSINIGPGVGYQFPVVPTNALNVVGSAASVPYVIWYA